MTTSPAGRDSTTLSAWRTPSSAKSFLPEPSTTGNDHQPVLVDEAARHQRLDELDGAVDEDVALVPVAQPSQIVEADHRRVVPLGILERRGDEVLRHGVELVGEIALARGPGRGEALVGDAAEQERVARHHLVELELVPVRPALELERPTAVLVALGPARILDDAVERDELGDDDLAHDVPPLRKVRWVTYGLDAEPAGSSSSGSVPSGSKRRVPPPRRIGAT